MIRALIASVAILTLVSGLCWHLGGKLHDERLKTAQLTTDLNTCKASYKHAADLTRQWSEKYNTDTQALKDETAKLYADQQARSQASCRASFNAGYRYGLGVGSAAPERLRGPEDDFRDAWLGNTAGH